MQKNVLIALVLFFCTCQVAQAQERSQRWPISCFVYRDVDRSGTYNLGDRAYAGLTVEIERPDGTVMRNQSNIAGFSNFELGLGQYANNVLYMPGTYKVRPVVPEDWVISDPDPVEQEMVTEENQIAGGGLVLITPCAHTGVIARLVVRGSLEIPVDMDTSKISLTANHGSDSPVTIPVNDNGGFEFDGKPGEWLITATNLTTAESVTRSLEVKSDNVALSKLTWRNPDMYARRSETFKIEFDDITTSDTLFEIPSGYRGLNWHYWVNTHLKFYQGYGYVNAGSSGEYVTYNSSGLPASMWREEPFDFVGTYITAAWPQGENYPVIVKAWRDGNLAYEDRVFISNRGPVYFDANYLKIDKIEFVQENYERLVIDDFLYRP